ncbi:MAG: hypothetical protein IIY36_11220, partial [Lachnospiraceae bacterium]|nr:hypothetical protein [Lachnospiraceae bacterium]
APAAPAAEAEPIVVPAANAVSAKAILEAGAEAASESVVAPEGDAIFLFKTATCPNCKAAGALLDRAGIAYTALDANSEKEMVEHFGVKQAPTLVLVHGDTFEKYRGVSDIKGWLKTR